MARTPDFEIGQTLLRAGGMWRRNLLKLGGVILAFSAVGGAIQVGVTALNGGFASAGVPAEPSSTGSIVGAIVSLAMALVIGALIGGVNGHASEAEVRGEKATFVGGWNAAWRNFLPQLGIQLILGVLFVIAAFVSALFGIFFIVPFLVSLALIIAFLGLAPMIQVAERQGVFASLSASINAGEGNHLKMLGYYIIAYIGAVVGLLIAYLVMALLMGLAFGAAGLTGAFDTDGEFPIGIVLFAVPLYLVFSAAIPLAAGAVPGSVYVSLRKHRSQHAVSSVFD
ncbi:hypothetical protein GVN21_12735 [Caulobacter sp. SLTY]|uniref:hypothetical protein n=1 Tax=Caulobacter sp. SLTY TaxID=2683262 RepID=UPI0014120433|nr:hypothetical protein [Caulobacter sp. SLTY]NBB16225.1 hypothetical protein [Caulobacter sp. SLTY]